MVQTITKEWQITKMYIYEVVLRDGVISLDWDDFETSLEFKKLDIIAKGNIEDLIKEKAIKVNHLFEKLKINEEEVSSVNDATPFSSTFS